MRSALRSEIAPSSGCAPPVLTRGNDRRAWHQGLGQRPHGARLPARLIIAVRRFLSPTPSTGRSPASGVVLKSSSSPMASRARACCRRPWRPRGGRAAAAISATRLLVDLGQDPTLEVLFELEAHGNHLQRTSHRRLPDRHCDAPAVSVNMVQPAPTRVLGPPPDDGPAQRRDGRVVPVAAEGIGRRWLVPVWPRKASGPVGEWSYAPRR